MAMTALGDLPLSRAPGDQPAVVSFITYKVIDSIFKVGDTGNSIIYSYWRRLMNISDAVAAEPTHRSGLRWWLTLPILLSGTFLVTLDFFIVNVALASMSVDLEASTAMIEWVVVGYGVANAVTLITAGRLGDLYGRRTLLLYGFAVFTLSSIGCGLAPNVELLIGMRLLQGLGGALLQPQVLAILGTVFEGGDRSRAFAWYGITLGLAATAGQLIGGALIDANWLGLGWRTCFLINVPIGCAAIFLAPKGVPALPGAGRRRLDLTGATISTVALTAILLPLIEGRELGWPAWSWLSLAATPPLLLCFLRQQRWSELRGGDPLIPIVLRRNKAFLTGLSAVLLFYAGNASFYFVLAQYMQLGLGLSPLAAGAMFSVLASGFFATSMASARLGRLLGPRSLSVGALILALGHATQYVVILDPNGPSVPAMGTVLLVEGAGIGMVMAPLVAAVLSGLPTSQAGVASGILAMIQQMGNSIGVALISILFYSQLGEKTGLPAFSGGFAVSLIYLGVVSTIVAVIAHKLVGRLRQESEI